MLVLRSLCLIAAGLALTAASQRPSLSDPIKTVSVPASRQQGVDMILLDADEMPQEPELAKGTPEMQEESWSGAPIDLMKPVHHLYTDLRRQLVRYQMSWSNLPQVRVPSGGKLMKPGSIDPRVPILRERLGLSREGGFDDALKTRLMEFQQAHGLKGDGAAGADTLEALNRGAVHYERLILLSMERARRLPAPGAGKYILVDAGSARLWMYEDGRPVDSMKVIVGTPKSETPMMAALLRYASVNPYWNIPWDLVQTLIAPRVLAEGTSYLKDRGYQVLDSWEDDAKLVDPATVDWRAAAAGKLELRMRQLPGPANSMGEIKFMMPNEFGIYLHDTPNKALFAQEDRWLSNGCVRVEDARRLARWIFGEMPKARESSREERVELEKPVPVYITYLTVAAEPSGLAFRADPYERNAPVLARFDAAGDGMSDAQEVVLASATPAEPKPEPAAKKPEPPVKKAEAPAKKAAPAEVKAKPATAVAVKPASKDSEPAKAASKEPVKAAPKTAVAAKAAPEPAKAKAVSTAKADPKAAEPAKAAAKEPAKGKAVATAKADPKAAQPAKAPAKEAAKAAAVAPTAAKTGAAAKTAAAKADAATKTAAKEPATEKAPAAKADASKSEAKPSAAKAGLKPTQAGAKGSSAR